jgi:hypothetical protein
MTDTKDRKHFDEIVSCPGKFEGEAAYVPYFWEMSLGGCFDIIDFPNSRVDYAQIDADDAAIFPELAEYIGQFITLEEMETGFVYGAIKTQAEIEELENDAANEDEPTEE